MSTDELTPFSYVVLALVGDGGAGAHDLVASMRHGRPYWTDSPRHFYSEPKRLARLGYLSARKEPGITRQRTIYALTERGRDALRAWIPRASRFPRIQNEALARLVAGYLVDDEALRQSFDGLREDLDRVRAGVAEAEAFARTLPERERYLRLVHDLGRRIIEAFDDWLTEVENEFGDNGHGR
jgi:PadR family transcriptional regulator, regulatory protein AphA